MNATIERHESGAGMRIRHDTGTYYVWGDAQDAENVAAGL
jgi:hypothetical protein